VKEWTHADSLYLSQLQKGGHMRDKPTHEGEQELLATNGGSHVPPLRDKQHSHDSPPVNQEEIVDCGQGAEPTDEDRFYCAMGDEIIKRNLTFTNEVLRQLVTLSTALVGGSMVFLKDGQDSLINAAFKIPAILFFLFALATAFIGMLPHSSTIWRNAPLDIRKDFERAVAWKSAMTWVAAGFLMAGLLTVLLGILVK
jgi:hypothetical protein